MSNYKEKSSTEKMNDFAELKNKVKSGVECSTLLAMVGRNVQKTENNNIDWYLSPFRDEKTPSFKVDANSNCYIDFGESVQYHDVVDLAIRLSDMGNISFDSKFSHLQKFSQAVLYLAEISGLNNNLPNNNTRVANNHRPASQKTHEPSTPKININSIKKLENPILIDYFVNKRFIDADVVDTFLKEVRYSFPKYPDKEFFSVGFENRSKGFELRSPPTANNSKGFKGGTSPKDITLIRGTNPTRAFDIWEGFTDMMTMCTIKDINSPQNNTIVMNSTSLVGKVMSFIVNYQEKRGDLKKVYAYVDNDKTGKETLHYLRYGAKTQKELDELSNNKEKPIGLIELGIEVIAQNERLYPDHNDLNALHTHSMSKTNSNEQTNQNTINIKTQNTH